MLDSKCLNSPLITEVSKRDDRNLISQYVSEKAGGKNICICLAGILKKKPRTVHTNESELSPFQTSLHLISY